MMRRVFRTPLTWIVVALLGAGFTAGLSWFEPWRLVTDTTVAEPLSTVASVQVASGSFVSHEHDTTGTARLVRTADGGHQLELAGLATSDGPDLRVWLTDQPVRSGAAGRRVFDDGSYLEVGALKGNRGDQIYRLDPGVDPAAFRSVSIWCKRFSVSFGAAALA